MLVTVIDSYAVTVKHNNMTNQSITMKSNIQTTNKCSAIYRVFSNV